MQGSRLNAKAINANNKTRICIYSNIVTTKEAASKTWENFPCWKIHLMVKETPNKGCSRPQAEGFGTRSV